ncbi:hypothetical protein OG21DRAFT_241867 [Imleria badia]|nr:hypothetical protein OG21DRAFT_241867 [Imleria badia]
MHSPRCTMNVAWNLTMNAIAVSLHSLAILCTLFRLWYRWSMALVWWDDAWALVALLADRASLISLVLEQFIPGTSANHGFTFIGQWNGAFAFSTIVWATRISILTFMIRAFQPEVALKRIALCIGLAFGLMWIETTAQRLEICAFLSCGTTSAIVTTQTAMDCLDCASDHVLARHEVESRTQNAPVHDVFCEHGHWRRHGHTSNRPLPVQHFRVHHGRAYQDYVLVDRM